MPKSKTPPVLWFVTLLLPLLLPILFLLGWLYGCLYLSYIGLSEVVSYYYIKSWPTTEGLILESRVSEIKHKMPSGWSYTYENHLKYSYSVQGVQHEGYRFSNNPFKKLDTEKFKSGTLVTVSYSPFNPDSSLLYQDFNGDRIMALIVGLIMIAISFIIWKYSTIGRKLNSWSRIKAVLRAVFLSGDVEGMSKSNREHDHD